MSPQGVARRRTPTRELAGAAARLGVGAAPAESPPVLRGPREVCAAQGPANRNHGRGVRPHPLAVAPGELALTAGDRAMRRTWRLTGYRRLGHAVPVQGDLVSSERIKIRPGESAQALALRSLWATRRSNRAVASRCPSGSSARSRVLPTSGPCSTRSGRSGVFGKNQNSTRRIRAGVSAEEPVGNAPLQPCRRFASSIRILSEVTRSANLSEVTRSATSARSCALPSSARMRIV